MRPNSGKIFLESPEQYLKSRKKDWNEIRKILNIRKNIGPRLILVENSGKIFRIRKILTQNPEKYSKNPEKYSKKSGKNTPYITGYRMQNNFPPQLDRVK